MSLMTTWTTDLVPPRRPVPDHVVDRPAGPRTAWDCTNCALLNTGARKRCADCGTRRDQP